MWYWVHVILKLICTCKLDSYAKKKITSFHKINEACIEECMVCINYSKRSLPWKESELLEYAGEKKRKRIQVTFPVLSINFFKNLTRNTCKWYFLYFKWNDLYLINYYNEKKKIAVHYQISTGVFKVDLACIDHDPQRSIFRHHSADKKKGRSIQISWETSGSIRTTSS